MNADIELHDSIVISIENTPEGVVLQMSAYVHRSEGKPGIDAGTVWSQLVRLTFIDARVETEPSECPFTIDDGQLNGDITLQNELPLPLSLRMPLKFEVFTMHGEHLSILASGMNVEAIAEATYIEEFPGMHQ